MKIGLLLSRPAHHVDIEAQLRIAGHADFIRADQLRRLPPPPWPDMVLLADWSGLNDEERRRLIHSANDSPCISLIIIAPLLSGHDAQYMLHGGVADILNSADDTDALNTAIDRQIAYLNQRRQWLMDHDRVAATLHLLTPRERDILRALSGGLGNKAAARVLGISPRTVEVHRANMLRRTGVGNITDLLKMQQVIDRAQAALSQRPPLRHDQAQPCKRDPDVEASKLAILHDRTPAPKPQYTIIQSHTCYIS